MRKATKSINNIFYKARVKAGLNKEASSEKINCSIDTIVDYELKKIKFPNPNMVLSMAQNYKAPYLLLQNCSKNCEIGNKKIPYIDESIFDDPDYILLEFRKNIYNYIHMLPKNLEKNKLDLDEIEVLITLNNRLLKSIIELDGLLEIMRDREKEKQMKKENETIVEINFPGGKEVVEEKMAEVLAEIILKKYGSEKARLIANELEKIQNNKK